MFYLSKILPLFVLPLGITMFLMFGAIVFRRRWMLIAAVVVLWLGSSPMVSNQLLHAIEGDAQRIPAEEASTADAVVVLSGGRVVAPGPAAVSEWNDADRFFAGVELLKADKASIIVFTGGALQGAPPATLEGVVLAEYAKAMGVAADRIATTGRVLNTDEEAAAVSSLLRERYARRASVLLVTSAFHMARARQLFEARGMLVTPFPVDFAGVGEGVGLPDILPTAGALGGTQTALREFYGRGYYRFRSWWRTW